MEEFLVVLLKMLGVVGGGHRHQLHDAPHRCDADFVAQDSKLGCFYSAWLASVLSKQSD